MIWERILSYLKFENTMMATSYFANVSKIDTSYVPIAICGKSPPKYNGLEYRQLAPKINFFLAWKNKKINNDEYVKHYYYEVLKELNPQQVVDDLKK